MSQAQKVLKEAGKLNVLDTSGNNSKVQSVGASRTLIADDSGKTWVLGNAASGLTLTLPSISSAGSGWSGKFIIGTAPVNADYVITEDTSADTNIVHGGVTTSAVDAPVAQASTSGTGVTQINFAANTALQGDFLNLVGDGTNWYIDGALIQANAAITLS